VEGIDTMEIDQNSNSSGGFSLINSHNFDTINTPQGFKSSQDFDTIGTSQKIDTTGTVGTSQNSILTQTKDPPNIESDDIITLNVGGIKVFDILTFIKSKF
jgi:hypothetical protein